LYEEFFGDSTRVIEQFEEQF